MRDREREKYSPSPGVARPECPAYQAVNRRGQCPLLQMLLHIIDKSVCVNERGRFNLMNHGTTVTHTHTHTCQCAVTPLTVIYHLSLLHAHTHSLTHTQTHKHTRADLPELGKHFTPCCSRNSSVFPSLPFTEKSRASTAAPAGRTTQAILVVALISNRRLNILIRLYRHCTDAQTHTHAKLAWNYLHLTLPT